MMYRLLRFFGLSRIEKEHPRQFSSDPEPKYVYVAYDKAPTASGGNEPHNLIHHVYRQTWDAAHYKDSHPVPARLREEEFRFDILCSRNDAARLTEELNLNVLDPDDYDLD